MNKSNLKNWIETSDWRIWLVFAIVIIFSTLLIQAGGSEALFNKMEQEIMASIDGTEKSIQSAREKAAKRDKDIDATFDRVMQSSSDVIERGHQQMSSIRQKMDEEKTNVQ